MTSATAAKATSVSDAQRAAEQFPNDVAEHDLSVLRDDGLYRHLRFRKPGTSVYGFDIHTAPYVLVVTGDMGAWVFSRIVDMLAFFGPDRTSIDFHYWAQKLQAPDTMSSDVRRWSTADARQTVEDYVADWAKYDGLSSDEETALREAVQDDVLSALHDGSDSEDDFRRALDRFQHNGYQFTDMWEHDFRDWTYRFAWICRAITWGVGRYLEQGGQYVTTDDHLPRRVETVDLPAGPTP